MERLIHIEVTKKAGELNHLSKAQIVSLALGASMADAEGWSEDWHFDGRKNFAEMQKGWNDVNARVIARADDYYALGFDVHQTQDFYSHSNYLELFVQYYKDKGGDMSQFTPDIVPLYEEGIKIQVFLEQYLMIKLRSGEFHLHSNEFVPWTNKAGLGEDTHYHMNKDSNNSLEGKVVVYGTLTYADLGVAIAIRATSVILMIQRNPKQTKFVRPQTTTENYQ